MSNFDFLRVRNGRLGGIERKILTIHRQEVNRLAAGSYDLPLCAGRDRSLSHRQLQSPFYSRSCPTDPVLRSRNIEIVHTHNDNRVIAFRRWGEDGQLLIVASRERGLRTLAGNFQ